MEHLNVWTNDWMIRWMSDWMTNHLNDLMTEWLIIQLIDGLATYSAEKDIGCKKIRRITHLCEILAVSLRCNNKSTPTNMSEVELVLRPNPYSRQWRRKELAHIWRRRFLARLCPHSPKIRGLLKEGQRDGTVTITAKTIDTDKTFELWRILETDIAKWWHKCRSR